MKCRSLPAAGPCSLELESLEGRQLLSAGDLTFLQTLTQGTSGVTGLSGAINLAVSPDGRQVYVVGSVGNTLTALNRDAAGRLTVSQVLTDGVDSVDGLGGADTVAVSPDGKNVYVGGSTDDAVAVFARNTATGALSFRQALVNTPGTIDGIDGIKWLTLSPDGSNLYAVGNSGNSLAVFDRSAATGDLTFAQSFTDGVNGVDGLSSPYGVTVSPDGRNIYTAAYGDNGVGVFGRNVTTGELTWQAVIKDGDTQGAATVDNLTHVTMTAVSPDGRSVYVSSYDDNAVVLFSRDSNTGALTFQHAYANGSGGISFQHGVYNVIVSPDGETVYATSETDRAINVFTRDTTAGTLIFQQALRNGISGVSGLNGVFGLTVSADNKNLYAAGRTGNTVAAFDRTFHMDVSLGIGGAKALTFRDVDGTTITVTMAAGTASVRVVGRELTQTTRSGVVNVASTVLTYDKAALTADKITLSNTSLASKLSIATSGGTTAGATLGSLVGSGPVGVLAAPTINLLGSIRLSDTGYIRTTMLGNMLDGSTLRMDGAGTAAGVVISAGTIGANATIQLACPLARLTAVKWTSGNLNGTTARTILVTGRPKIGAAAAIPANFGADIVLSGKDAYGVSLYLLSVPGTLSGDVGVSLSGSPAVRGDVRSIVAGAWTEGQFQARDLTSLMVRGQVGNVTLHADRAIRSIYAAGWTEGLVDTPTLYTLRIPGRAAVGSTAAIAGDFGANVTAPAIASAVIRGDVTGDWTSRSITLLSVGGDIDGSDMTLNAPAGTAGYAIRTLAVAGTIKDSTITSTTNLGTITTGGMSGSKLLVGVIGTDLPADAGDFDTAHPGSILSLLVRGLRNETGGWVYSYADSIIAAWNLGRVTVYNVDTSNDGTALGIVGHSLTNYVRLNNGQLWTSTGGAVTGPTNPADAPLVLEHAGDYVVKLVPVPAAG